MAKTKSQSVSRSQKRLKNLNKWTRKLHDLFCHNFMTYLGSSIMSFISDKVVRL
jgi:hypothetical protein